MIKRLLLAIAGIIVVVGILTNAPTTETLETVGVLIFLVLGIAMIYPGVGCIGPSYLTSVGMICLLIAFILALDVLGLLPLWMIQDPNIMQTCYVTTTDINGTVISRYETLC